MADESHLDQRYFVDLETYNCPFCNRRGVRYELKDLVGFHWTPQKACKAAFVKCASCTRISMHLTYQDLRYLARRGPFGVERKQFQLEGVDMSGDILDDIFFHSVPSSFFALDERIPKPLRELLSEAEACLKGNHLTGASACARKLVYELAVHENAKGDNYEERLKSLKELRPDVDPIYFDNLLTVQQITSEKVHENAYDGWESKHLRAILATLHEALTDLYVVPAQRVDRRKAMLEIQEKLTTQGKAKTAATKPVSN